MIIHRLGRRTSHAVLLRLPRRLFTYLTLYNPDSLDNNRCDKRILAITNLETENKTNKPRKNVLYLLNCAYRLGRLKRQQTSDGLRFLHRSYMRTKQNGGLLLREKQARQLSTRLNRNCTALQSQIDWTIEPKFLTPIFFFCNTGVNK